MSDRIRVLTLLSGLAIGDTGGGADKFGLEVARHLNRDRFEPIVCAFWQRGYAAEEHWRAALLADGVKVFFATPRGPRFSLRAYASGLRCIAAETQPGVAIVHSHFQLGSIAAIVLRRALAAQGLVRTAHGTSLHEWTNSPIGRLCRFVFTRSLFPLAFDQEVGVSAAATASLNTAWGTRVARKPAIMIPNAIPAAAPPSVDRAAKRQELGFEPGDIVIGSVGRLSEQKGYIYLVRAAPLIFARYPEARIALTGDGELRGMLEQEARSLGVVERIRFLGLRTDAPDIYRALDLFVLPSLWEGLPTVALEAMAYGAPVVATDIPGTRDLLVDGENGWLARPADPADLARAVLTALESKADWTAVTARAAGETVPQYRIERVAERYGALYEKLCGQR